MASHESYSLAALVQKCTSTKSLRKARQLHALILTTTTSLSPSPFLNNNLLSMYAKSGSMEDARRIFDRMPLRNQVSYSALIAAYSRIPCHAISALQLYQLMLIEGLTPSSSTFASLLQASSSIEEDRLNGVAVHGQVVKWGFLNDIPVQTSLLGMYSDCGNLELAGAIFSMMSERDVIAWNSMILGQVKNGRIEQSLHLFSHMVRVGSIPTQVTFSIALNACSRLGDHTIGKIIHAHIIKSEYPADTPLMNALLDMYASCGDMDTALSVFTMVEAPDLVSWNSMIAGYSENADGQKAMELFVWSRQQSSSENPDEYTFAAVVSATGALPASSYGKPFHAQVKKAGLEQSIFVASTLINMYFKNNETESARKLFNSMLERDVILWTEMISSHSRLGEGEIAVEFFRSMQEEGHRVDSFSLSSVLSSAADLAALRQGEMIHSLVVKTGHEEEMCVCGSLVDMYAKNGDLEAACLVFSRVEKPDLKCWNSMLGGYGHHGNAEQAFKLFNEMGRRQGGLRPDRVTFISLLSACSHCRLVEEGNLYWNYMKEQKITPGPKHYSCMVSLLSRAGLLREAENLILESPFRVDFPELWRILLSSCVRNKELGLGVRAAEQALRSEPEDSATHVLLSNLYAATGRWDAVAEMRKKVRGMGAEKDPGLSWIETQNEINVFSASDDSHPQVGKARLEIQRLHKNMQVVLASEMESSGV